MWQSKLVSFYAVILSRFSWDIRPIFIYNAGHYFSYPLDVVTLGWGHYQLYCIALTLSLQFDYWIFFWCDCFICHCFIYLMVYMTLIPRREVQSVINNRTELYSPYSECFHKHLITQFITLSFLEMGREQQSLKRSPDSHAFVLW